MTPKETVIRNELGSFLIEPLIPPTSKGNAASSDRTVIDSCSSLQWWSQHRIKCPSLVPVVRMLFGVPAKIGGHQRSAVLKSGLSNK